MKIGTYSFAEQRGVLSQTAAPNRCVPNSASEADPHRGAASPVDEVKDGI